MFKKDTEGKFSYRSTFVIDPTTRNLGINRIQIQINELQASRTDFLKRNPFPSLNPFLVLLPTLGFIMVFIGFALDANKVIDSSIALVLSFFGGVAMISGVVMLISGAIGLVVWLFNPRIKKWVETTGKIIKPFDEHIAEKKYELQKYRNEKTEKRFYRFYSGNTYSVREWEERDYQDLLVSQRREPIVLMRDTDKKKSWWMFMDDFYCENESYTMSEIKVLILDMIKQRETKIKRAEARLAGNISSSKNLRQPIPDEVKAYVWQRDGGRCVNCGSQTKLEYDHIIPVSKGGSNTARNIQLLCEKCNREKGANIA